MGGGEGGGMREGVGGDGGGGREGVRGGRGGGRGGWGRGWRERGGIQELCTVCESFCFH
jgi:hypothetical protein